MLLPSLQELSDIPPEMPSSSTAARMTMDSPVSLPFLKNSCLMTRSSLCILALLSLGAKLRKKGERTKLLSEILSDR
jgi:hypothetical protein